MFGQSSDNRKNTEQQHTHSCPRHDWEYHCHTSADVQNRVLIQHTKFLLLGDQNEREPNRTKACLNSLGVHDILLGGCTV